MRTLFLASLNEPSAHRYHQHIFLSSLNTDTMAHDIPAVHVFVIQNTVCYFYVLYKIVYCFVPVQIMSVGYLFCTVDPTKVSAWENVTCVNRVSMLVKKRKEKK